MRRNDIRSPALREAVTLVMPPHTYDRLEGNDLAIVDEWIAKGWVVIAPRRPTP